APLAGRRSHWGSPHGRRRTIRSLVPARTGIGHCFQHRRPGPSGRGRAGHRFRASLFAIRHGVSTKVGRCADGGRGREGAASESRPKNAPRVIGNPQRGGGSPEGKRGATQGGQRKADGGGGTSKS